MEQQLFTRTATIGKKENNNNKSDSDSNNSGLSYGQLQRVDKGEVDKLIRDKLIWKDLVTAEQEGLLKAVLPNDLSDKAKVQILTEVRSYIDTNKLGGGNNNISNNNQVSITITVNDQNTTREQLKKEVFTPDCAKEPLLYPSATSNVINSTRVKAVVIGSHCEDDVSFLPLPSENQYLKSNCKTEFIYKYTSKSINLNQIPSVIEDTIYQIRSDSSEYALHIFNTTGTEMYSTPNPLADPHTSVIIAIFSLINHQSFSDLQNIYIPQLKALAPKDVPIILVGTRAELRKNKTVLDNLKVAGKGVISKEEAEKKAKEMGCLEYIECSVKENVNVEEAWSVAVKMGAEYEKVKAKADKSGGRGAQEPFTQSGKSWFGFWGK